MKTIKKMKGLFFPLLVVFAVAVSGCTSPPPGPVCGNNQCETGETPSSCPQDCQQPPPPPQTICGNSVCETGENPSSCPQDCPPADDPWVRELAADVPQIAEGWGSPVLLEVGDGNWGDSLFVTRDGNTIYFMWYPGDLLTDQLISGEPKDPYQYNADIYKSQKPFTTKQKDTRFFFVEDPWSAAGIMFDSEGNAFYFTNRYGGVDNQYDNDIYKNSERLRFNTNESHENPHYCKAKDELWMSMQGDREIWILKNAAASGFSGTPEITPSPLNIPGSKSTMPWLSGDCNTIYFASDRRNPAATILEIYTSERTGDQWSVPEPVIWGVKYSVGEPTLTDPAVSGEPQRLFYEQVFHVEGQGYRTEFFYVERTS